MLRDDAVVRIKRRLLFREDTTIDAAIVDALKDAQERLEQEAFLPWFLLSEVASILTEVGEERVPIPTTFIREFEEDHMWWFDASASDPQDKWVPLLKDDLDTLREAYPGSGSPKGYALVGDYFRIFPTPNAQYTLKQLFYKHDVVLDTNVENDWLKHAAWWLIGEAGADIAYSVGKTDIAERFKQQALESRRRVEVDTIAREEANRRPVKGGLN